MIKKSEEKKERRKGLRSETSGTRRSATLLANDRRSRADSRNVRKNGLWIFCVARPLTNDARIWKRDGVATPCVIGWATRCAGAPLPSPGICFIARFIIFRAYRIHHSCDSATQNSLLTPRPLTATKGRIRPGNVRNQHRRVVWKYRTLLKSVNDF